MQSISAKEVDASRPKYIIIFDDAKTKHTNTVSSVLNRGKAENTVDDNGISILSAGETGVQPKVYESLGVAAADLSKSQHDALSKRSDVLAIVENEIRYLPPVRKTLEEPQKTAPPDENQKIVSYLQGLRDAAIMALAFEQGSKPVTAGSLTTNPLMNTASVMTTAAAPRVTWGLKAIGVASALNPPTGKGVKVAVLDTGIDLKHPDLRNKVIEGVTAVSKVKGVTVQDTNGHGTHCAGIISGPRQSASGVRYGVAPDVDLLVGKVFNNNIRPTASDDDIIAGITWAEQSGARIISMSLGSDRIVGEAFPPAYEQIVSVLMNRSSNSVLLIAAAGNESERPVFTSPVGNPASCPSIMAVAAVDRFNAIASFSCRQMDNIGLVDIAAPGVAVFSSFLNGTFEKLDGTSMATPFVAGLAALYLERDPKLNAKKLFAELQTRARQLGVAEDFGAGLMQL